MLSGDKVILNALPAILSESPMAGRICEASGEPVAQAEPPETQMPALSSMIIRDSESNSLELKLPKLKLILFRSLSVRLPFIFMNFLKAESFCII